MCPAFVQASDPIGIGDYSLGGSGLIHRASHRLLNYFPLLQFFISGRNIILINFPLNKPKAKQKLANSEQFHDVKVLAIDFSILHLKCPFNHCDRVFDAWAHFQATVRNG